MGLYDKRPCPCGSGKTSHWLTDAKGIPVSRVCPDCEAKVMDKYRSRIFTDINYNASEPIEEDEEEHIMDYNPYEYMRKKKTTSKPKRKIVKKKVCGCKK